MSHPIWIVPGAPWQNQFNACRRLLIEAAKVNHAVGIDELVDILPLNPVDPDSIADIIARGKIVLSTESAENNGGEMTRASFHDDNIGSVRLVIPQNLKANVSIDGETFSLLLVDPKPILILADLPIEYPFSGNFILEGITLDETSASYLLRDQIDPYGAFEIKVDLQQSLTPLVAIAVLRSMPTHRRRKLALAINALSDETDRCIEADTQQTIWVITKQTTSAVCRIQHTKEMFIGEKIYGPGTAEDCKKQLQKFRDDGVCF